MSLLDTLRKSLDSDLFAKVTDALGDDFNYDQVPRTRLNKVIAERNAARTRLEAYENPTESEEEVDVDSDSTPVTRNSGKSQGRSNANNRGYSQADIDAAVKKTLEESDAKIRKIMLKYAATAKLRESKFTDPELVLDAGLIDFSKVELDERGIVTGGLDDQIAEIAKTKPFLVEYQESQSQPQDMGAARGTGRDGGVDNFGSITSRGEFLKLPTDKQLQFKTAYPDVFKGFMEGI